MSNLTYIQLLNKTLNYYFEKKYKEGFQFLKRHKDKVNGNQAQLYNFLYTLAAKAGQTEQAMQLLKEAVYEKDFWYAAQYLKSDEDLTPLKDFDDFDKIVKTCAEREEKAKKESKPKLNVQVPKTKESGNDYPLLISLHGNQENSKIVKDYWLPVLKKEYILALPQSSQIEFSEAYVWEDIDLGIRELKHHFNNLKSDYNIDLDNIILGAFSAGARVILESIKQDIINPKGIILLAPWLPDIKEKQALIQKLQELVTKIYIICGKEDKDCLAYCEILVDKLKQAKVNYKYDLIKDLQHDYPQDFAERLNQALNFIED